MPGSQCTQDYIANLFFCGIFLPQGIVTIEETVKHHGHHVLLLVIYARYSDTFRKRGETKKTGTMLIFETKSAKLFSVLLVIGAVSFFFQ